MVRYTKHFSPFQIMHTMKRTQYGAAVEEFFWSILIETWRCRSCPWCIFMDLLFSCTEDSVRLLNGLQCVEGDEKLWKFRVVINSGNEPSQERSSRDNVPNQAYWKIELTENKIKSNVKLNRRKKLLDFLLTLNSKLITFFWTDWTQNPYNFY